MSGVDGSYIRRAPHHLGAGLTPGQHVEALRRRARRLSALAMAKATPQLGVPRLPRNAPCSCGSGRKSKRCCGRGARG